MSEKEIKIIFLQFCENAFFDDSGKLNMIGIFDSVQSQGLPTIHPKFSIVISVSGQVFNKKKVLKMESPSGKVVLENPIELPNLEDKPYTNIVLNFINFSFEEKGLYRVRFEVEGKTISSDSEFTINVI